MRDSAVNRRQFLSRTAVAGGAIALPAIVPARVVAGEPGNTVVIGLIGTGARMNGVMGALRRVKGVQFAAVCDVLRSNRDSYLKRLKLDPKHGYNDFRELLTRSDIDAVAIATPDHWHVPISIAAIESGKDVYCEKPLSNTIAEGRELVRAVNRYGAVFQHGTQLHSLGDVRRSCELVRNGKIGALKEIVIGSPAGKATGTHPEMPIPEGLDYDLWLGPAPVAPYTRARVFRHNGLPGWYFVSDYSKAGWIAGYGVHDLDIAQWGMGLERTGPVSIEGRGKYPEDGLFDTIMTYRIDYRYANGVKITMTDTGQNRHGVKFIGEDGWIFTRGKIEAGPQSILKERIGPNGVHLYRSTGHAQNFIDCVRSRSETITSAEIAHRATSAALLGGIACKLGRRLEWDPDRERFGNDEAANRLLSTPLRSPWRV